MHALQADKRWIKRESLTWILLAQALAVLPVLFHLPIWLGIVWLLALVWRIQIYRERLPFPSTFTKAVAAGVIITALILSSAGKLSMELLIGLFFSTYVLKLLEFRKKRDGVLLIFLGFFAVATQFIFMQTMLAALYGFICCLVLLAAWRVLNFENSKSTATIVSKLADGGRLLLHALPIMLFLFIIMPRVEPLWSLPSLSSAAKTGFSDTMSPGDVSRLVASAATAFRVEFDGQAPEKESLYWRGLVLDYFNGRSWRVYPRPELRAQNLKPSTGEDSIDYTVTLEPHGQRWLFTLNTPVSAQMSNSDVKFDRRLFVTAGKPVNQRVQYHVQSEISDTHGPKDKLDQKTLGENLALPAGLNPRTQEHVKQWLQQGLTPQQIVQQALKMYSDKFSYTLEPSPLGRHSIDEFLFETQKGFCEHFSSSFVFMLRAAGVPARVVVGYLGGSKSPVQDYYIVKQSDAHAWAEVWLQGIGWQRIDPTASVAPERVETGISQALSELDLERVGSNSLDEFPIARFFRQHIDAIGYAWNKWVLAYDNKSQQSLFEKLLGGTEIWRIAMLFVVASLSIALCFYLYFILSNRDKPVAKEIRILKQFYKKAKRMGLEPVRGETVSRFVKRLAEKYPDYAASAAIVADLFERISYGGEIQELESFKSSVRHFPYNQSLQS